MKNLLSILLVSVSCFAQQTDTLKTTVFSFTPVSKKIDRVNGLALGVGLALELKPAKPVTVNGLNLEINPLSPLIVLFLDPDYKYNDAPVATVNGLHISTGGFMRNAALNGLGIALYSIGAKSNGMSITGIYNANRVMNGLHISGMVNSSQTARGLFIATFNYSENFGGLMLGGYNRADYFKGLSLGVANVDYKEMSGVQIGLFNRSKKVTGLQIGLWNINEKRSLPFINF
jgi:hypothetical protein